VKFSSKIKDSSIMKFMRSWFPTVIILFALIALQACKAKKLAQKPTPPPEETAKPATTSQDTAPKPKPVEEPKQVTAVEKPDYNFSNLQFDFDSSILKTASYPALDKVASEMKKDLSVKFNLSGYASLEGTDEHNMTLSQDRANAVKVYLVNAGIRADNLTCKGYGTTNPIADNSNEDGKTLNRRVEIKKQD
jgi:OOP family OmpA-OmpF porin